MADPLEGPVEHPPEAAEGPEKVITGLLRLGVGLASALMLAGLVGHGLGAPSSGPASADPYVRWIEAGLVVLIVTPVVRVAFVGVHFLKQGDGALALCAGLVLAVLVAGLVLSF